MQIIEGQIYEGTISLCEGTKLKRRWIVVAPFGKKQIHSLDNPTGLLCWPISLVYQGIHSDRLKFIESNIKHPIIQLQRDKETYGIKDTHLGLNKESLESMLTLLQDAVKINKSYVNYAANEIIEFMKMSLFSSEDKKKVLAQVNYLLETFALNNTSLSHPPAPATPQPFSRH